MDTSVLNRKDGEVVTLINKWSYIFTSRSIEGRSVEGRQGSPHEIMASHMALAALHDQITFGHLKNSTASTEAAFCINIGVLGGKAFLQVGLALQVVGHFIVHGTSGNHEYKTAYDMFHVPHACRHAAGCVGIWEGNKLASLQCPPEAGPLWSIPEWNVAAILGAQGMGVPSPALLCRLELVGHVHVIAHIYSCVEFRP